MSPYHAKKRLGQNFLQSEEICRRIVELVTPSQQEYLIEIGSGQGALTVPLAESGVRIFAIEFDRDLIGYLSRKLKPFENVHLINEDFLTLTPDDFGVDNFYLVGNLPYNITSPVIDWCCRFRTSIVGATFMVQQEVADRLSAAPGCKDWSPIAIMTQVFFDINQHFTVGPEHFYPSPKVSSAVITLTPYQIARPDIPEIFETLVRVAFRQRRKMLINNLAQNIVSNSTAAGNLLDQVGLDRKIRAEHVTIEKFIELSKLLSGDKSV